MDRWPGRLSRDQREFAFAELPGGRVLVAGGWRTHFVDFDLLDAVELYDGSAWFTRAPLPEARLGPAAAALGDAVFVFGGLTRGPGAHLGSRVCAYRPAANEWTTLGEMPTPTQAGAAIALDDQRSWCSAGSRSARCWSRPPRPGCFTP